MKTIPLTKGKEAIVADVDFDHLVSMGKWYCLNGKYAARTTCRPNRRTLLMHTEIMKRINPDFSGLVDHKNTDSLDNRRENLRPACKRTNAQNRGKQRNNSTGYKGVSFDMRRRKYLARIHTGSQYKFLGYFSSSEDASKAYTQASIKYHKEFARQ